MDLSDGDGRHGGRRGRSARQCIDPFPQEPDFRAKVDLVGRASRTGREVAVVAPPIQADFLRFVEGADQEPDTNCQEFDLGK
jgi:hypothetical protein